MVASKETIHAKVRERYTRAAAEGGCCGSDACCAAIYLPEELARIPAESVLGLGSGNPVRHADLKPGETVVDLGSGAGVDVFLAAELVGPEGRAIGIDMTPLMVDRARAIATERGISNVSFLLAPIESMPLPDASSEAVVSNCVINLSPAKLDVFREAFRVLKPRGRLVISDVVQEWPLGFIEDDCGCVATAMVRGEYLETIRVAGFLEVQVVEDRPCRSGPDGPEASAVTVVARKPNREESP
jgi:SAM-dependent methyltransferase